MAKKIKPETIAVLNYLKEHNGEDLEAVNISNALDIPIKSVNGIITRALAYRGYAYREEVEMEPIIDEETGKTKKVKPKKYIRLTDEGMEWDPEAEMAAEDEDEI